VPKQTFYNLTLDKRTKIEQAALDEFVEYGFDNSNISRIVAQSKIAKGSFYQYFEDKKDLYFHLIDIIVTQKMQAFTPFFKTYQDHTFSENFRDVFQIGLDFADTHPKYYLLGEDFTKKHPAFIREFVAKYQPLAVDLYMQVIKQADLNNELRERIDIPNTVLFINTLINNTMIDLIMDNRSKKQRDQVISELIIFIESAVKRA